MNGLSRFAAIAVFVLPGLTACGAHECLPPPNVVVIVMDTTRGDRCSVNGYSRATTPRLEALGAEGVVFRNAWSPSCWTGPAHATLFTGLRPEHHGFGAGIGSHLSAARTTLAERLQAAGYRTACFTKNSFVSPEFGLAQGFEKHVPLYEDDAPSPWAPATHRAALAWAKAARRTGAPFFLFLNHMEPHHPYEPPPEWERRFLPEDTPPERVAAAKALSPLDLFGHNMGAKEIDSETLEVLSHLYDAEIAFLDHAIGEFVGGLREALLLDDTILVITSDHGENFGEHGLVDHGYSLNRTLRHVPLVLRYPRKLPRGWVVSEVVRLSDLLPTLLELAGLPPAENLDGETVMTRMTGRISPAVLGVQKPIIEKLREAYPEPFSAPERDPGIRSVFDGRHHLIRYTDGREELYDVSADPRELADIAPTNDQILIRLRDLLPPLPE